jgi:UDP-N-acetylglucosamine--N-acetylmuramyl-(pentapeptide) pyrophosphoryl-undecaprenol N-acetylglucosamine transferase
MMKVVVTGGGTGGHIYPAIAIGQKLRSQVDACDILYIGSRYGLESEIVTKNGLAFSAIDVRGFDRQNIRKAISAGFLVFKSLYQAYRLLNRYNPDCVVGTGGYVSGPVVFMAALMGKRTYIHEQNAIPGWTTKLLSKVAKRIFISYEETRSYFKGSDKVTFTGNPIRTDFDLSKRQQIRLDLGVKEGDLVILSFGGSNGARGINSAAQVIIKLTQKYRHVTFFHGTGKRFYNEFNEWFKKQQGTLERVNIVQYFENIADMMVAADILVSRAGAITLAEMAYVSLPSLLIPSPYVANNHQFHNALAFVSKGTAIIVEENSDLAQQVELQVENLIQDCESLLNMRKAYEQFDYVNSLDLIVNTILSDC